MTSYDSKITNKCIDKNLLGKRHWWNENSLRMNGDAKIFNARGTCNEIPKPVNARNVIHTEDAKDCT